MPCLEEIRRALRRHRPRVASAATETENLFASVAVVLSGPSQDPRLLFIERAEQPGDPWSGHMAFPGGRVEEQDETTQRTAERETCEEVGLDLSEGECLGRLDDQEGRRAGAPMGLVISAWVYYLETTPPLSLNSEVREALWVPSSVLVDPANRVDHDVYYVPGTYPGILVGTPGRHVIWGLTYRFLRVFMEVIGETLP